ncbi:hypothetical protein BDK51DRAFT_50471 [Blyttiomyces helicus]|uniref:Dienelactone hydrolase domain-containing protein n=1 Tax=Blyttiomyces helicus TaxID=388810 RepID=A0A4P9VXC4_9FUNG|nr:hypothetical protein BDK51DRAFT_50471 [Blyttiomyces helicus]|eukprot:RKO82940.1 hypothetical protein BDK51DRAFT_50471 [Blyttiomyces helicus]
MAQIAGINVHIAKPASGSTADAIIILPDVFGTTFKNTQKVADDYAKKEEEEGHQCDYGRS